MKHLTHRLLGAAAALLIPFFLLSPAMADGDPAAPAVGKLTLLTVQDINDANDKAVYYAIPEALPGEKVTLYVPMICENEVANVTCEADAAGLPSTLKAPASYAAIELSSGAPMAAALADKQKVYFGFTATLADVASAGEYTVPMTVKYQTGGADAAPLKAGIRFRVKAAPVITVAPAPTVTPAGAADTSGDSGSSGDGGTSVSSGGGGGSGFRSKPKVIVEAYSFDQEKLYAGEQVALSVTLRNTSAKEAVKNLQLNFSNEAGVVTPVSGGSNSIYIGELKKNATCQEIIRLQIAPDAEAKAQMLAMEITYEGTRNRQEFTEKPSIAMPILQKTRVRTDQPVVYDEAWAGQTVNMGVQMFNMGKSTLYNCMVDVTGDGLSLEETYYGGNIASGSTMRADLTVKTETAGAIEGQVRITYEDVFGEQSEQVLPVTINVQEEPVAEPLPEEEMAAMAEVPQGGGAGILSYWWIAVILLVSVILLVILLKLRQRRARLLEDDTDGFPEED